MGVIMITMQEEKTIAQVLELQTELFTNIATFADIKNVTMRAQEGSYQIEFQATSRLPDSRGKVIDFKVNDSNHETIIWVKTAHEKESEVALRSINVEDLKNAVRDSLSTKATRETLR